ncbi:MAG TPA: DUF1697 domain-containing protein [Candidatus Saccharimonadales bacterium]|nr:DUF1697 domain-containing protein [Candidatus Saccharimonadales bacterium]
MKYVALLRGINVGGNNKVSMAELKKCFEELGFENVRTYINSGNVIFEAEEDDKAMLVQLCEQAIEKQFGFNIVCSVITAKELQAAVSNAPSWWGNDAASKHNAIFAIAPSTAKDIVKEIGEEKPEYEKIAVHEPIIFWSAPIATFSRTRYSKIVGTKAYKSVTIRNANTTKKLAELCG